MTLRQQDLQILAMEITDEWFYDGVQVWYIPQALQLTHGGFFHENSPGIWDTPESARLLLKHLKAGNPDRIASLQTSDGKSVSSLIDEAAKHRDSRRVVDLFLEVKDAVCSADEVLVSSSTLVQSFTRTRCRQPVE